MSKQISYKTNTAYVINMWCQSNHKMLPRKIEEWVRDKHQEHWEGRNNSILVITYKIQKVKKCTCVKYKVFVNDYEKHKCRRCGGAL